MQVISKAVLLQRGSSFNAGGISLEARVDEQKVSHGDRNRLSLDSEFQPMADARRTTAKLNGSERVSNDLKRRTTQLHGSVRVSLKEWVV